MISGLGYGQGQRNGDENEGGVAQPEVNPWHKN